MLCFIKHLKLPSQESHFGSQTEVARASLSLVDNAVRELASGTAADPTMSLKCLCDELVYHQLPPVCLGWRSEGAVHKLAGVCWQLCLENRVDLQAALGLAKSVIAWTTDMGTEFKLNDFRAASFQDLLPWTHAGDLMDEQDFDKVVPSVPDDVDDLGDDVGVASVHTSASALPIQHFPEHVFPRSMQIPGFMHIGHNALSGAMSGLAGWASTETSMQHLTRLFGHKGPKERFVNTLLTGEHACYGQVFSRGQKCPTFTAWRWRSISHVGRWLLRRKVLYLVTVQEENLEI
eukprot:2202380-Amphidinium_carterae.2